MIGERIKKLRKDFNLTQQEFSERIGIKRNTIAKYETGRGEPIDAVISLICREFNVNEMWLRTGDGEMFVPKSTNLLEELVRQRNLTHNDYILMEKFLALKPEARKAVMDYAREVVAAANALDIPSQSKLTYEQQACAEAEQSQNTKSAWEKEADEFAEIARQQYLAEKKRELGTLSVKKSGVG